MVDTMETPPNLNTTAQPIESNENKTSCRATTSPRQLIAVLLFLGATNFFLQSAWSFTQRRKRVIIADEHARPDR